MRAGVCVVCVMLVAALPAARAEPQTKLAPLDPVRTVHVGTVNQASDARLYVAIEKGYFAELRLKVDLATFTNAATVIAPLGSGELDVGGGYLAAYAKGAPPAGWLIDVMMKYVRVKDRTVFASVTPAGLDAWGCMDLAAMRSDFEWFKARRLIASSDASFEGPIDTSFVAFAQQYLQAGR